jgi:Tol biopolymer transport system component
VSDSQTVDAFTEAGAVVGTVAYMSPEQASGRSVDHRSDQFSLGIVLFEMLAGRRPFTGDTAAETLTAIIREEPAPLETTASGVPAPLRWVVERLLTKEPGGRYDSTRDLARDLSALRLHLAEPTSRELTVPADAVSRISRRRSFAQAAAAIGIGALAVGAGVFLGRSVLPGLTPPRPASPTFQRLTTFDGIESWPTLSPDGKTVAYQKSVAGKSDIFILRVGGRNPVNLTASLEGDQGEPAFSPDGRLIAFRSESDGRGIFAMEATGESVRRLTDFGHVPAWFPDGKRMVVATESPVDPTSSLSESQLWIVDLGSGTRRKLPVVGRAYQPSVSPHGVRIAYGGVRGGQRDIYTVGTAEGGAESARAVTDDVAFDWSPFWSGDGRDLYFASSRGGAMNLWRVRIDETSGATTGAPEPVTVPASWAGPFRTTPDGSRVVFASAERERTLERLPFDLASEKVSGPSVPIARFGARTGWLRASPRGDLLTLGDLGGTGDLIVLKTDGTGVRKPVDDDHQNIGSNFSPDGRRVVFYSNRTGTYDAWVVDVDGSGMTPVTRSAPGTMVTSPIWSSDGKTIAASRSGRPLLLPYPRSADDPLPEPGPVPGEGQGFLPWMWSPDSKAVVGFCLRADGSWNGIVVYDVVKKTYRRASETGIYPAFLPDGRRVAFLDVSVLKLVEIATGRTSEILKGDSRRAIEVFALAPDGRSLYVSWASTQADLWLMTLGATK